MEEEETIEDIEEIVRNASLQNTEKNKRDRIEESSSSLGRSRMSKYLKKKISETTLEGSSSDASGAEEDEDEEE